MKINLWLSYTDGQDGSFTVKLQNTKEEALNHVGVESEEEIDNTYDQGYIEEITLDIDENGKLITPFRINIE